MKYRSVHVTWAVRVRGEYWCMMSQNAYYLSLALLATFRILRSLWWMRSMPPRTLLSSILRPLVKISLVQDQNTVWVTGRPMYTDPLHPGTLLFDRSNLPVATAHTIHRHRHLPYLTEQTVLTCTPSDI